MSTSFIQIMDNTAKAMVFNRFADFFSLDDINRDLVFFPKAIAQRKIAEKRGEGTVEFISLWRTGISYDWARNNTAIARKGVYLTYNDDVVKDAIITARAVPAMIEYDLWFWSRDLDKIMKATESYLLWQHDHPNLLLDYNNLYPMEMYLKFGPVIDESTLAEQYDKGLYFVSKMHITMEGWILTLLDSKTVLTIYLDVYMRTGVGPNWTDVLLDEYVITTPSDDPAIPTYPEAS